jgi:hypothetical protein
MRTPSTAPGEGCGGSASGIEAALCRHSRWSADGNSAAAIEGRATPAYSTSSRAPPPLRQFGILSPGHAHETRCSPCRDCVRPRVPVELGWLRGPSSDPDLPGDCVAPDEPSVKRQARVPKESARRAETGIRCAFGELFCYPGLSGTRLVRHVAQDWIRCGHSANRRRSSARRVRYTLASSIVDSRPRVNSNDTTHVCRSRSVHMLDGNRATAVHPQLSRTISCVLSKLG